MFVYTIQPVVKPVVKPVVQPVVSCKRGFSVNVYYIFQTLHRCSKMVILALPTWTGNAPFFENPIERRPTFWGKDKPMSPSKIGCLNEIWFRISDVIRGARCKSRTSCHNQKLTTGRVEQRSATERPVSQVTKYVGSLTTRPHCSVNCTGSRFQSESSSATVENSSITTKHLYLILTFPSHHDIFIRRSWYSVLPSLDATVSCRIKTRKN